MKRRILSVVAALAAAGATASDLFVPSGSVVTNCVPQGSSETFSGRLAVADDGVLAKTGAGAWTVPGASLCQYWPFTATVCEGTLALTAGGTVPANEVPAVLQNDATLWLSMKDTEASHFVKNGNDLIQWYDVREADVSTPKRFSVKADFTYAAAGTYPQVTTYAGFPCVYFRGVGSGVAMSLRNTTEPNTMAVVNSFHVFAVVCHANSQGIVFGSGGSAGNMFMATVNAAGVTSPYADPSRLWPSTTRGKTCVDGVRCDPYAETPPVGRFHLLDSGSPVSGRFAALFGQWASKSYWGGDYLAEAIVFTREISETERVQIQSYLARKWFPDAAFARAVRVEKGAVVRADDFDGLTVSGEGDFVKTGSDAATYRTAAMPMECDAFNGGLTIAAGSVNLASRLPLNVTDGTAITVEKTSDGNLGVTTATAASGALVKSGSGDVALAGMPSGVTELKVEGGALEIERGVANKLTINDSFYVPIENPGFETYATEEQWKAQTTPGQIIPTTTDVGTYVNGWRRSVNQTWMLNWRILSSTWKNTYNLTHQPHDGDVVAMIHQNGILATPVSIPKAGTYELAFDVGGREAATYLGDYVKCSLYNVSSTTSVEFGRGVFCEFGYRRVKLRARVTATGAYELRLRDADIADRPIVVDNVSLRYVSEREKVEEPWRVPNGGFEFDSEVTGADNRKPVTESPFSNWTFDAGAAGSVAVVTAASTNGVDGQIGVEYSPSRGAAGGFRQLLMKAAACSATVTCTPPAGTHYLRADLGRYYQIAGSCTATVAVGTKDPVTLGTFNIANSVMRTYVWETPFETSGAEEVAIAFSFARKQDSGSANCGIWLDDVCLVPWCDRNYVANGGFETTHKTMKNWADGWEALTNHPAAYPPSAQVQPYSYLPNVFSSDPLEGTHFLYFQRTGGAAHPVTFDCAGLYRLSFHTAFSRRGAEGNTSYNRGTPVRAWLANGATTNEIGRTGEILTTNFCQHVWTFRVTTPGTYMLGLQGTSDIKIGCNVCVDAVSVRRIDDRVFAENPGDPVFDEKTKISIAAGARLRVDFEGTNKVDELRLGGHKVKGYIDVADYPDYLSGCGCFLVEPKGLLMIVK